MEPLRNGEDSRALVFEGVHDAFIARQIRRAIVRVLLAAPGIREGTAEALADALERVGADRVELVVDCDEQVARLGLGDVAALERVMASGVRVRHAPGLRVGVLICDDAAWVFSPTALVVSAEVHSSETPNAIVLSPEEARRIALSLSTSMRDEGEEPQVNHILPEVGIQRVSHEQLANTQKALKELPPRDFDVARQVRVFDAYVEFVEMTLEGFEFKRRKVRLPPHLVAAADDKEVAGRLSTTFEPIRALDDDNLAGLKEEFSWIREEFTGVVSPHGRVILRRRKAEFQKAIEALKKRIDTARQAAQGKLAKEIGKARDGLLGHLERNRNLQPPRWQRRYFEEPTPEEGRMRWLAGELDRILPTAESLVEGLKLTVQYKGVTHETLSEPSFLQALRKAFPGEPWDKPMDEYMAARERPL